ncbi:MAG: APC family permease [Frankia sp.]
MTDGNRTADGVSGAAGGAKGKGLRPGAIGLIATIVIGVASTAPGYSIAASLTSTVGSVGVQAPLIMVIAFVPMLFIAYAYKELNAVDPDCGTTFTWGTRAFGPVAGWMGGWAIIAADVIVMANLAQIAGQYTFSFVGADGLAAEPRGWVTVVGVIWIFLMTYVCYRGIRLSARTQFVLLAIELVMLVVFAVVALAKVWGHTAGAGAIEPSWSWFNPADIGGWSAFSTGVLIAVFLYWGWDTAVAVNEETDDVTRTPGRAAVLSTLVLLVTYVLVTTAAVAFAGTGSTGTGLNNQDNAADSLSILGKAVFGGSGIGSVFSHLLILAVLSSAAASTQTTILPTARTTLSMAVWKALPDRFGSVKPRFMTPAFSTWAMGAVSVVFFAALSYLKGGAPLGDLIAAIGLLIAFYYGLTGFASVWFFRRAMRTPRDILVRGVLPGLGGLILLGLFVKASTAYYAADYGNTSFHGVGGVFLLGYGSLLIGVVLMIVWFLVRPAYFRRSQTTLPISVHTGAPLASVTGEEHVTGAP